MHAGDYGLRLNSYEVAVFDVSREFAVFGVLLDYAVVFSPGDLFEDVFTLVVLAESIVNIYDFLLHP